MSSRIFTPDTIDVKLVEFLVSDGYDVWTSRWRGSIDVPASRGMFTVDDVARYDHPAALDAVRAIAGANDVHVLTHCVGSITFSASLLGGWAQGVRSTFLTQVATHMRPPAFTRFKTGLHVPGVLKALGVKRLDGSSDRDSSWRDRLFETALRLHPIQAEERCASAVCRRITFMYGGLFEHDQLNRATHGCSSTISSTVRRTTRCTSISGWPTCPSSLTSPAPRGAARWSKTVTTPRIYRMWIAGRCRRRCYPARRPFASCLPGWSRRPTTWAAVPRLRRESVTRWPSSATSMRFGHSAWRDVYPLVTGRLGGVS